MQIYLQKIGRAHPQHHPHPRSKNSSSEAFRQATRNMEHLFVISSFKAVYKAISYMEHIVSVVLNLKLFPNPLAIRNT